ncbi:PP2C family protein-serine/threonine phosphatase [Sediminitomix flava]|uniref:Serine phosphatase RsbU (Regulator of sigma subunit) n=1 Tax=Sediminitomix flava TaxID=379075 RepID=A0A315ZDC0_SEDFL|nr:SpoIIE family protein phosphatase [Sediminitomix flava]PWJ42714.1 serine phosphatase RsbU (regulator of sigma subunit) [Sediminitomix flava]
MNQDYISFDYKSKDRQALEKELKDLREEHQSMQSMFEMTTAYLNEIREELKQSEGQLKVANKYLLDSINYSKHIQDAFIGNEKDLNSINPNSFLLSLPKDTVSGDFLWQHSTSQYNYLGIGDCTGHGVSGAMLSIYITNKLKQISTTLLSNKKPRRILKSLDHAMENDLKIHDLQIRDSVEIGMIRWNKKQSTLDFTGAKRSLILVRDGQLITLKGDRFIMGNPFRRIADLSNHRINIQKGDTFYIYSDGFPDQFGGEHDRKYSSRKLNTLLKGISQLPLLEQKKQLKLEFDTWKADKKQLDDVILLGLKFE